jgi:hypothetical protein
MIHNPQLTDTRVYLTIEPCPTRNVPDRKALESFHETCSPLDVARSLAKAMIAMSYATVGLFKDVLHAEIRGPHHQHLSLIELPGLINLSPKSMEFVELLESITDAYIKDERTIILAVLDAVGNVETHRILQKTRLADPTGERTFVIITKPDLLEADTANEADWLTLALEENSNRFTFDNGRHVLVNHDGRDTQNLAGYRDKYEEQFFQCPRWGNNSGSNATVFNRWNCMYGTNLWGADNLRCRLDKLLHQRTQALTRTMRKDIWKRAAGHNEYLGKSHIDLSKREILRSNIDDESMLTLPTFDDRGSKIDQNTDRGDGKPFELPKDILDIFKVL